MANVASRGAGDADHLRRCAKHLSSHKGAGSAARPRERQRRRRINAVTAVRCLPTAAAAAMSCCLLAAEVPRALAADVGVKFCDRRGPCELVPVSAKLPAKFCVNEDDLPSAWLRPFVRPRLKMTLEYIDSSEPRHQAAPLVAVTEPLRQTCKWLADYAGGLEAVKPFSGLWGFCRDCSTHRCDRAGKSLPLLSVKSEKYGELADKLDFHGADFAVYLSSRGGCIHISRLPDNVLRAMAHWELSWDPLVPVQALLGVASVFFATEWSQSALIHGVLGGTTSLVVVLTIMTLWTIRELRNTIGKTGIAAASMLSLAIPSFWASASEMLVPWSRMTLEGLVALKDPFYGLPLGLMILSGLCLMLLMSVSWGVKCGLSYFASLPDPDHVDFRIASDGRRLDVLPSVPIPQRALAAVFWLIGLVLLATCSYADSFSLAVVVIVLVSPRIFYYFNWSMMSRSAMDAAALRPLMSTAAYEEEARTNTEAALAALRQHLQQNSATVLAKFGDKTELRLRRFSEGGAQFGFADDGRATCDLSVEENAGSSWWRFWR